MAFSYVLTRRADVPFSPAPALLAALAVAVNRALTAALAAHTYLYHIL